MQVGMFIRTHKKMLSSNSPKPKQSYIIGEKSTPIPVFEIVRLSDGQKIEIDKSYVLGYYEEDPFFGVDILDNIWCPLRGFLTGATPNTNGELDFYNSRGAIVSYGKLALYDLHNSTNPHWNTVINHYKSLNTTATPVVTNTLSTKYKIGDVIGVRGIIRDRNEIVDILSPAQTFSGDAYEYQIKKADGRIEVYSIYYAENTCIKKKPLNPLLTPWKSDLGVMTTVGSDPNPGCSHTWTKYEGFTESYNYCSKCDCKRG